MPVALLGSLTMFLCTAALATGWPAAASTWLLNISLATLLVAQFRLWDDLSDIAGDQVLVPQRVLCRTKSLVGFRIVLGLLFTVNVTLLATYKSGLSLIAFLILNFLVFAWYTIRGQLTFNSVFSHTIVLLKYPVFVYLLSSHAGGRERILTAVYAMSVTFLCFCIYELLHDHRVSSIKHAHQLLMLELMAVVLVGFLILKDLIGKSELLAVVQFGLVVVGSVVLIRLLQRSLNQVPPGRWCYAVFLVGFVWLLNYALASYPASVARVP